MQANSRRLRTDNTSPLVGVGTQTLTWTYSLTNEAWPVNLHPSNAGCPWVDWWDGVKWLKNGTHLILLLVGLEQPTFGVEAHYVNHYTTHTHTHMHTYAPVADLGFSIGGF